MTIQLFNKGLYSEILNLEAPARPLPFEKSLQLFEKWTRSPSSSTISSAYARRSLEQFELNESIALAQKLRSQFENMVVLGIGGSALGTKAVYRALDWSLGKELKLLHILDNLDPVQITRTLDRLPLEKTCFCVISKSGGTLETMTQFSLVLERLRTQGFDLKRHVVAITDPTQGTLRQWVKNYNVDSLTVPQDVGGRFSVFTSVGTLPLAFAGFDVRALLAGANEVFLGRVFKPKDLLEFAQRLNELTESFFSGHLLMPYASVLKEVGEWFVQLWGESLGKTRLHGPPVGSIPLVAVGATDQHSLLQLLVEGPKQILTGFIEVAQWPKELDQKIPPFSEEFQKLSFASGKTLAQVLNAELEATARVFYDLGRPFYKLQLDQLTLANLGALFAFYMDVVTLSATLTSINPYDQPGVELGKQILPKLLREEEQF